MSIEIKKSEKPVIYEDAKKLMEERLLNVDLNKSNELIWTLEHPDIYTAGTSYSESDILDKSIKILETNRGGKITYHGPGQLICYFVIDLKKRKKDIRNFISIIEKTIIETLNFFNWSYRGSELLDLEFLEGKKETWNLFLRRLVNVIKALVFLLNSWETDGHVRPIPNPSPVLIGGNPFDPQVFVYKKSINVSQHDF